MEEYVKINSTITIVVTSGLQYEDFTKVESDIKDRLKVGAKWRRHLIKQGIHKYPAEIATWTTVRALERQGILTVVKEVEEEQAEEEPKEEEQPKRRRRKVEDVSLNEVAGE